MSFFSSGLCKLLRIAPVLHSPTFLSLFFPSLLSRLLNCWLALPLFYTLPHFRRFLLLPSLTLPRLLASPPLFYTLPRFVAFCSSLLSRLLNCWLAPSCAYSLIPHSSSSFRYFLLNCHVILFPFLCSLGQLCLPSFSRSRLALLFCPPFVLLLYALLFCLHSACPLSQLVVLLASRPANVSIL